MATEFSDSQISVMRFVCTAAFVIYALPIALICVSYFSTGSWNRPNVSMELFGGFAKNPDLVLGQLHRSILPLISVLAVAAFRDDEGTTWARANIVLLLVSFFVAIMFSAMLQSSTIVSRLEMEGSGAPFTAAEARGLLSRMQDTILLYLMLIVGVRISGQT